MQPAKKEHFQSDDGRNAEKKREFGVSADKKRGGRKILIDTNGSRKKKCTQQFLAFPEKIMNSKKKQVAE